jgi:hypothetical protein
MAEPTTEKLLPVIDVAAEVSQETRPKSRELLKALNEMPRQGGAH